jgi:glutathione S-transferase
MARAKLGDAWPGWTSSWPARPGAMGDTFTVADAYLFTVAGWGRLVGVDIAPLAHLSAYMGRVAARPAVQAALKAEGLLK